MMLLSTHIPVAALEVPQSINVELSKLKPSEAVIIYPVNVELSSVLFSALL